MSTGIIEIVAKNIGLNLRPFRVCQIGTLRLKRSLFSPEESKRMVLQIDNDSLLHLSTVALRHGMTTDEYLRHIIWSL